MRPREKPKGERSATIVPTLWLVAGCSLLCMLTVLASDPASWNDPGWWASRGAVLAPQMMTNNGVVTTNYVANNSSVVNQGQLKKFTSAAVQELNADLPTVGAGPVLSNLVYNWQQDYATNGYATNTANPARPYKPGDLRAVNVGELKYIASLVYGQIASGGYPGLYPSWIHQNTTTDILAANQGQLKRVFDFNLTAAPAIVTGLSATAVPGGITLTWTIPANDPITSLTILQTNPDGTVTTYTLSPTMTSFTATGLTAGASYAFGVQTNNGSTSTTNNLSPGSTPTPLPPTLVPPPAPGNVTGYIDSSDNLYLSWPASPAASSYTIDRETIATGVWATNYASSSGTSYEDTAHQYGGYRYRVNAHNSLGSSPSSSVYPPPAYAVIDFGAGIYPAIDYITQGLKLTDSGYLVLEQPTSNTYPITYYRWFNGAKQFLSTFQSDLPSSPGGLASFPYASLPTCIREDGTVAGYTTSYISGSPQTERFYYQEAMWAPNGTLTISSPLSTLVGMIQLFGDNYVTQGSDDYIVGLSSNAVYSRRSLINIVTSYAPPVAFTFDLFRNGSEVGNVSTYTITPPPNSSYLDAEVDWNPLADLIAVNEADQAIIVLETDTGLASTGTAFISSPIISYILSNGGTSSGTTLPFIPFALSNQATIGSTKKTYVLGKTVDSIGYQTGTMWWDGSVHTVSVGAPTMINAQTATVTVNGVTSQAAAPEMIGGDYIWAMNPVSGIMGQPQSLNDVAGVEGWSSFGAASLNDLGTIVGTATYSGTNTAIPAGSHGVMLVPVQVNHADGTNEDQPMAYLPQWTPNNGSGRGQPIFHTPTAVFQMSSIGATMNVTFLGHSYMPTQNASNHLLYQDTASGLSVLLSSAPLNDPSVQESLQATVNLSSAGVMNAVYTCDETTASSNVFQDDTPGITIALAGLSPTTADTMTFTITGDGFSTNASLTESGPNTLIFAGNGITVQLVNSSTVGGTLYAALTYSSYGYSNTVMSVPFISAGQYQNFAPPTPTDQTAESVDSFASFYIQLPVALGSTPSVDLTAQVNGQDVDFGTVDLVSAPNNMWRSAKKLVLLSTGADASQMTSTDSSNFQTLQLPAGANLDWTKGGGIINVVLNGVAGMAPKPQFAVTAQANGVALESLDFLTWVGQGIDVENRIRQPFIGMGYTMDSDYSATTPKTLSTYVTGGKQIWYSISHGNTSNGGGMTDPLAGTPQDPFNGLTFKDYATQGVITAARLPAGLNYRLVICDGCCSAQTSLDSELASQGANTILSNCSGFADKFGQKVAYMGWSWDEPPTIQQFTAKFVSKLQGVGVTVQSAYQSYLQLEGSNGAAHEMKIYGNVGAIIDLSSNPNAAIATGP